MANRLRLVLEASDEQWEIINCDAPLQVLIAGRRWGKTATGRNKLIKVAMSTPNAEIHYIAPTYRRSLKEFKTVYKMLKEFVVEHRKQPPAEMYLDNGTRISFLSFDNPDAMLGDPADFVLADEAARLDGQAFWEVVQPMTADRDGRIMLITTPLGEDNWMYETYHKALAAPPSEARCWMYPTPTGPAFTVAGGKARLERIRRTVPEYVWDREYLCKWTVNDKRVFRHLPQCVQPENFTIESGPLPGCVYVQGLDLGDVVDHTSDVIFNATRGYVVDCKRWPLGSRHEVIASEAAMRSRHWNNCLTVADATGGASGGKFDSVIHYYRDKLPNMKPFIWSPNANDRSKTDVINFTALEFENKRCLIHPRFNELIVECRAYEFEHRGTLVVFSAPAGKHDDYVSAIAMCLWARKKGWISSGRGGQGLGVLIG